jgi:hypothetical protein
MPIVFPPILMPYYRTVCSDMTYIATDGTDGEVTLVITNNDTFTVTAINYTANLELNLTKNIRV